MVWANREENVLNGVITYVGRGARANLAYIASKIPGSHLEQIEHGHLSWTYACLSPPDLGRLDGMKILLHLEGYEGEAAAQRARFANTDALCVLIDPPRQLVPFLNLTATRERAEAAGLDWSKLPVAVQVLRDQPGGVSTPELREMTGEQRRRWIEAVPASGVGIFDTLKILVLEMLRAQKAGATRTEIVAPLVARPGVMQASGDDEELAAAYAKARASVEEFIAKLARPGDSTSHAIYVCLRDGEIAEHVWLAPVRWDGRQFSGTLDNVPVDLRNHRLGDAIQVGPSEIEDWMYIERGKIHGGYTVRVQAKRGNSPPEVVAML